MVEVGLYWKNQAYIFPKYINLRKNEKSQIISSVIKTLTSYDRKRLMHSIEVGIITSIHSTKAKILPRSGSTRLAAPLASTFHMTKVS
jgi:hypothetical protein